jgi:hypothetical protein
MISPEFDTFPVLAAEQNALTIVFRGMFAEKLRARGVATGKTEPLLADLGDCVQMYL